MLKGEAKRQYNKAHSKANPSKDRVARYRKTVTDPCNRPVTDPCNRPVTDPVTDPAPVTPSKLVIPNRPASFPALGTNPAPYPSGMVYVPPSRAQRMDWYLDRIRRMVAYPDRFMDRSHDIALRLRERAIRQGRYDLKVAW